MKDLEIIRSLLYSDMKERLGFEYRLPINHPANNDITLKERDEALVNAIAECCDMSDINSLLSIYSHLFDKPIIPPYIAFRDHQGLSIVSIEGTQNYIINLLTRRIAIDLEVILTKTTLKPQSPLGPLKHEYK
tara:strand:+ start:190 stop:588 length:399 start_codon:yes stop_codon:yes gene_type:complete